MNRSHKIPATLSLTLLVLFGLLAALLVGCFPGLSTGNVTQLTALVIAVAGALVLAYRHLQLSRRAERGEYAHLLLESSSNGVIALSAQGCIEFANGPALKLLGYDSAAGLVGRDLHHLVHNADREGFSCTDAASSVRACLAGGEQLCLEQGSFRRQDGSALPVQYHCAPIQHDEIIDGVVLTFSDDSAHRATAERLRLHSAALQAAANGIVITNRQGEILWVNAAFCDLTGYPEQELLGRNTDMFKSGRQGPAIYRDLWDTILSGRPWRGQWINQRRDGSSYHEEVTITPVLNAAGQVTHFIGIKQDISESKRAEEIERENHDALAASNLQLVEAMRRSNELALQAERANAAKTQFLATMSHEIRTPMHAILGSCHQLEGTRLAPKQQSYLRNVKSSATSLLGTINDILDFSKIEAGMLQISQVEFSVPALFRELGEIFLPPACEKGLKLHCSIDPSLPPLLLGDPLRVSQILHNLLSNAVKFTRHGVLSLEAVHLGQSGDRVELQFTVRDTGLGIPAEQQPALFQPFRQLDGSITRSYGGSGLGLAICRQLTTLMGGEIQCQSVPGVGSCFTLRLPFSVAGQSRQAEEAAPCNEQITFDGERVLVVEDNVMIQAIAQEVLEQAGLRVTTALNGVEALERMCEASFDLVLMDSQMPLLDGVSATRRIRAGERRGEPRVPIIAVTANAMQQDIQSCLAAGADGHLAKPFSPQEMLRTVHHWLHSGAAPGGAAVAPEELPATERSVPALDLVQGIRQIGGSTELYGTLLRRFVTEYRDSCAAVQAELTRGNFQAAALLAHSVKGIAGVLAALPLQDAAGQLERSLSERSPEIEASQRLFCHELERVLHAIPQDLPGEV